MEQPSSSSSPLQAPEEPVGLDLVFPGDHPLDQPDFEVVSHINSLFPTEQSLAGLNDKINSVQTEIETIDQDIRSFVRSQTGHGLGGSGGGNSTLGGIHSLNRAQASIETLVAKILDMKGRAEQSEAAVRDMTRDIRQLDAAKRNLTSAITTLNHLNMVVGGVDKLQVLVHKKQYGDVANLLQGVGKVVEHFENYNNIPQVQKLSSTFNDIKKDLCDQLSLEFRESFSTPTTSSLNSKQISEACQVLEVLDPRVKLDLLNWFVHMQLKEYLVLFDEREDVAWLDKIDKRYAWLKKHLIQFEERYGQIFPSNWDLSQRITMEFCHQTRKELGKIMGKRRSEIDVKLLLSAIQKTTSFENLLYLRFGGHSFQEEDEQDSKNPFIERRVSLSSSTSASSPKLSPTKDYQPVNPPESKTSNKFSRIITQCFDPFLFIYIESQDKNIADMLEKFTNELRSNGFPTPQSPDSSAVVLSNCADLFLFYKKCLVQCTQLSCGEPMLNLGYVFSKRLRDYCTRILQNNLPKIGGGSGGGGSSSGGSGPSSSSGGGGTGGGGLTNSVTTITRELMAMDLSTSGLMQNFQSFLKDGETIRFSRYDLYRICCILTTAEYCVETTQQLEEKLKEKLQDLSTSFGMESEKKLFLDVIEGSVNLLVQDLYSACEPALITITKINWQAVEAVGDQSGFISAITSQWKITIPALREFLSTSRKYFLLLCQQFAKLFMTKFLATLHKCKNISKHGAQQLLLDTQSLKTSLLDLPSIGLTVKRKPPDKYSKIIVKELGRTEMIIKIVMSPVEQIQSFVDHTCKLVPDCDLNEFIKILDMKGYKRTEQIPLIDEFKVRVPTTTTLGLVSVNDRSNEQLDGSPTVESSRIKKLEKLLKKRL